jgi:hypothetical protein
VDGAGGLGDGSGEQIEGGPAGRGSARPGGAVEPDDGVEVDDAAPLVLDILGVGDPDLGGQSLAPLTPIFPGKTSAPIRRTGEATVPCLGWHDSYT